LIRTPYRAAALAAAASAAAVSLAGCASNMSPSAASSPTATTLAAKGVPASDENTHILVYNVNSDGAAFQAVVTGKIGDYGPALTVYPNGKTDTSHSNLLELKLTKGSFRLDIAALGKAFVKAAGGEPIYPQTCSDFATATATAPVVAHSGTGSYRDASGSFRLTITLDEVEASSCKPAKPANFRWQVISISGSGTVSSGQDS
jgi:hypothetical protein